MAFSRARAADKSEAVLTEILASTESDIGYPRDEFRSAWACALAGSGRADDAVNTAQTILSASKQMATLGAVAQRLSEQDQRQKGKEIADQVLSRSVDDGDGYERVSLLNDLALTFKATGIIWRAKELWKQAQDCALVIDASPTRLEALILLVKTQVRNGQRQDAVKICDEIPDPLSRAVVLSALLLASSAADMSDDDFFLLFDRIGADTVQVPDSNSYYELPLAHLILEQAIRNSGRQETLAVRLGLSEFVEKLESSALHVLLELAARDGDLGLGRAINVLRIAAGLSEFPPGSFNLYPKRDALQLWRWFKSEASKRSQAITSFQTFSDSLRRSREKGLSRTYQQLAVLTPFVFTSGLSTQTWEHIRTVEKLLWPA